MDKGIRGYTNAKFLELLSQRSEMGNTLFRKTVMCDIMEQFSITLASAATHYNHSFKEAKKANPALVEGLGRADDKKGGRKPKLRTSTVAVVDTVADPMLLLGYTPTMFVDAESIVQTEYTVMKKADNSVIATGVSFDAAREMVAKAATAKKAKLYYI